MFGPGHTHRAALSIFVSVLVAALLFPFSAMARHNEVTGAQKTTFTGTANMVETVNAGEWTNLPNGNVLVRGIVERYNDVNSDPRLTGVETITSDGNFKAAPSSEIGLAGHLWGTLNIENAGGAWDGTFTSEITEGGEYFYRGVAHGSGGYAGLKAHFEAYRNGHSGPITSAGRSSNRRIGDRSVGLHGSKASKLSSSRCSGIGLNSAHPGSDARAET